MRQSVNRIVLLCKKVWKYLGMVKRLDESLVPTIFMSSAIKAVLPYIKFFCLGSMVDRLLAENWQSGILWASIMVAVVAAGKLINGFFDNCLERKRQLLFTSFKCDMHMHYLELDYGIAEKPETKETIAKANSFVDMYGGLEELVFEVGRISEALISVLVAMFFALRLICGMLNAENVKGTEKFVSAGLIVTMVLILSRVVIRKTNEYMRKSKETAERHGHDENVLGYFIDQVYLNADMIYDIKIYDMQQLVQKRFDMFLNRSAKNYEEEKNNGIRFHSGVGMASAAYHFVLFVILIRQVFLRILSVGLFTEYYNYFLILSGMISSLIPEWGNIDRTCNYLQAYGEFMGLQSLKDRESGAEIQNVKKIEFRNVSYKYPGAKNYALQEMNYTFEAGKSFAIVGKNGAGKSTVIKLLCGLYEPTQGSVLIDGVDLNKVKAQFQKKIGTVFQECVTFPFTIGENVACREEYDSEQVINCLEKTGIKDKVLGFPNQLETNLLEMDEEGVGFSGGERQKIVIARALYEDHLCYVLDEPASALDVISENELYETFAELTKDKLGILVSHRMSGCTLCDSIIVMDEGKMINNGKHADLLNSCDEYKELWYAQAKYYSA